MQLSNEDLFLLALCAVAMASIGIIAFDIIKRKNPNSKLKDLAKYNKRYHFYYENFFTRKSFRRIVESISALQLYSPIEIRVRSVKVFQSTTGVSLGVLALGMLSVDDIVLFFMIVLFVYIMNDTLIQRKISVAQVDVNHAMSIAIASLRDCYTRFGEIPEAIASCTRDPILDKTFDNIHAILTESNGEELLDQYYLTQQSPVLRTLATVCHALDKYGDAPVESNGIPSFKQALMFMKDEIDAQVRKDIKTRLLFKKLEVLPVVPVMFIGIVEWFFMYLIPGTSLLYKGFYGYIVKIAIIVFAIIGYRYIANASRANYSRVDDRVSFIDALLDTKPFNRFITDICPKKAKVKYRFDQMISGCLSNKDIKYIYAEKVIYSSIIFVISLMASVLLVNTTRSFIKDNIMTLSITQTITYTEEEEAAMRAYDNRILSMYQLPPEENIYDSISEILFHASTMDVEDQVDRVQKKYIQYHSTYYHWWFILIVLGLTVLGWYIPDLLLSQRKKLIINEAEEDVLQMQTIILILSTTLLDTQEVIYWLSKNSGVHRDHLNFCYQEYPSDPEKAIARLKKNSVIPEFHQICDKLSLTAFRISISEAFSDLIPERQHLMRVREMVQDSALEARRHKASPLAQAPLYILIFGLIVGPILILGISQFMQTIPQLTS